jgi:hypothetical protein
LALVEPRKERLVKTEQLGRLKKVGQGLALVERKLPNGSYKTAARYLPGQLEGWKSWSKGWA